MATQATHVRRKHETDKSEKNSESKETSEAPIPVPAKQRPSRTKPPPNNSSLKGKAKKNESAFLVDSENFNDTNVLSDFAYNKSAEEIGVHSVINESIVGSTHPAINSKFDGGSFIPGTDFSKAALSAGNNNYVDLPQGYGTFYTSSVHQTTNTTSSGNGVVLTTNIGSTDSTKGVYAFDNIAPLGAQEYNNTRIPQEITRVTLSSVHKVEGNKDLAASAPFIQHNFITSESIIEKTVDTSVFDVPTTPINKDDQKWTPYNIDANNRIDDNTIIRTNTMINTGSNELQNENDTRSSNDNYGNHQFLRTPNTQPHDSERARSFECEGSASNTHLVRSVGPSEAPSKLSSNPQQIADQSFTKASVRGRPKKTTTAGRGRPKKVKPNETEALVGAAEGITTEVKSVEMQKDLPEVEGLSVAIVDENTTKIKYGKRGRPSKAAQAAQAAQTGEIVTNPTGETINESTSVPKKRGRPKKDATNNDESNVNLVKTKTGGKTGKRGRPRKVPIDESHLTKDTVVPTKHSGRGRPRKVPKIENQQEKATNESTTVPKKRGRPRKEVSEGSELKEAPGSSEPKEPKEAPEGSELKEAPEGGELKEAPEGGELKVAPEGGELKGAPEPKGEPIETTVGVKTGKRGRPKKISINEEGLSVESGKEPTSTRKRGRPRKEPSENNEPKTATIKTGKRGRPRKKPKTEEELSAISNELGVASGSGEHQSATENDNNASSTIPTVDVDKTIVTTDEITADVAEEVPEESIDELIDELTATN